MTLDFIVQLSSSKTVHTLEQIDKFTMSRSISGAMVIVGMGSIGSALGVALVAASCNSCLFFFSVPPRLYTAIFIREILVVMY